MPIQRSILIRQSVVRSAFAPHTSLGALTPSRIHLGQHRDPALTASAPPPSIGRAAAHSPPPPRAPPKQKSKEEGSIASVFASLSGSQAALPARFAELKASLVQDEAHAELLQKRWCEVLEAVKEQVELTCRKQGDLIPHVTYPGAGASRKRGESSWLSAEQVEEIKKRGVAVIKNVVPKQQALDWKQQIREYAAKNPVKGFPEDNPQVFELYWSKPQLEARAHPALLDVSRTFLQLFHQTPTAGLSASLTASLSTPLTYADRLRIRLPGDAKFALGPHIDGGGVERWEGEQFRSVFRHILQPPSSAATSGDAAADWRSHDPFDIGSRGERIAAETSLYDGAGQCSVMRNWQGWLALSETKAAEGTLKVLPFLKESSAYIMLRPFFRPKNGGANSEGFLEASNWKFDTSTSDFPGCSLGHNIELSTLTHPHLQLSQTMTSIPSVEPGDMVLWHCDLVHAVESVHAGAGDSSVMYIPAVPLTQQNWQYVCEQREAFLAGVPPSDFPGGKGESLFMGRGQAGDVKGNEARRAMALEKLEIPHGAEEGEKRLIAACNAEI